MLPTCAWARLTTQQSKCKIILTPRGCHPRHPLFYSVYGVHRCLHPLNHPNSRPSTPDLSTRNPIRRHTFQPDWAIWGAKVNVITTFRVLKSGKSLNQSHFI
jgi:hypothetical protein